MVIVRVETIVNFGLNLSWTLVDLNYFTLIFMISLILSSWMASRNISIFVQQWLFKSDD
jgi:hypothetical protein